MMNKGYEHFNVGEICLFKKTFNEDDFTNFSLLSGDINPLHHDDTYAKQSRFKKTIVPLHLAATPLSAIAGVVFPGDSALYLGHDLKALKPVPYHVELTYSAKIIEKIERDKILVIRTIVFNKEDVYIEATQRVQVRGEQDYRVISSILPPDKSSFLLTEEAVLITGAAGEIGRNIALRLAKSGKSLVLNFRVNDSRVINLTSKLKALGCDFELLELDLESAGKAQISEEIKLLNLHVGSVIHCACPCVNSPLSEHMKVNFESLRDLFSVLKYQWLSYQSGKIIFISSAATHHQPTGWENYIAGKSATENYLKGIHQHYAHYGINAFVLAPGFVDTVFSQTLRLDSMALLLAEQVAEEVVSIHENITPFYTWLEANSKRVGSIGFIASENSVPKYYATNDVIIKHNSVDTAKIDLSDSLKHFFNRFFKISEPVDWEHMEINMISVWDSLRHIELLIAFESEFNITVTAHEVDQTKSFQGILNLLINKAQFNIKEV